MNSTLQPSEKILGAFDPILRALGPARASLASISSVVLVRPGYRLPDNGAPIPALVIAVERGTPEDGLNFLEVERQPNGTQLTRNCWSRAASILLLPRTTTGGEPLRRAFLNAQFGRPRKKVSLAQISLVGF